MNHLVQKLFEEIRVGSANEQNDAIGKLVEMLRKNYLRGMDNYAYILLIPSDPLFNLKLADQDKIEIIDEIGRLICSEWSSSPTRASLLWALGSAYEWQSFELLMKFLRDSKRDISSEEFYQALISFDNLLVLGRENQTKLHSLLETYDARQVINRYTAYNKTKLHEVAVSILRQIAQLECAP